MKATQEQYEQAIKRYDAGGARSVFRYAEEIGVDSHSFCRDCEEHTPDCHDDCCLVCGTHKPSTRKPQLILRDHSSILFRPLEAKEEERYRKLPPFVGGDDWHNVSSMLDLNVWEDGDETKAAIYLVADGKTLTSRGSFIPIDVNDIRTKPEPEPEPEPETIERGIRRVVIEHNVKQIGNTSNKFPPRILPAKRFGDDFDKYEGLTLQHEEGRRDGVWVLYSQTFLYTKKSDDQLLKEFN